MLKITVNKKKESTVDFSNKEFTEGLLNGNPFKWDIIKVKEGTYHIVKENRAYNIEVLDKDYLKKLISVKVNGTKYDIEVKDEFDVLLQSLGMDVLASAKVTRVEAPMPGLVLDVRVKPGDIVKEGDVLVVLEAMKMENNIKSPSEGVVKLVPIIKGTAVEKKELLVEFE